MNGPEHFREAERLAGKQLRTMIPNEGTFEGPPTTDEILRALTHAVLGLTAASAANIRRNGAMPGLADGWAEILAEPVPADPSDGDAQLASLDAAVRADERVVFRDQIRDLVTAGIRNQEIHHRSAKPLLGAVGFTPDEARRIVYGAEDET